MPSSLNGTGITFSDGTSTSTNLIPSGTAMLFVQTAAPTGWTKSTAHNNKALRVVSGTASSGGSVAFTTAFASGLSAGATTLSTAQMPSHSHTSLSSGFTGGSSTGVMGQSGARADFTGASTANTGGGGSHTHTLPSFDVSYVDTIIATKD